MNADYYSGTDASTYKSNTIPNTRVVSNINIDILSCKAINILKINEGEKVVTTRVWEEV